MKLISLTGNCNPQFLAKKIVGSMDEFKNYYIIYKILSSSTLALLFLHTALFSHVFRSCLINVHKNFIQDLRTLYIFDWKTFPVSSISGQFDIKIMNLEHSLSPRVRECFFDVVLLRIKRVVGGDSWNTAVFKDSYSTFKSSCFRHQHFVRTMFQNCRQ